MSSSSSSLKSVFASLRQDLIHEDGPQISTIRNYRFAIALYPPAEEFKLRQEVKGLSSDLRAGGWFVLSISLKSLILERIRAKGPEWIDRVQQMERRMTTIDPSRGVNYLKERITPLIEGPEGIAADCSRIICEHADKHPDHLDRTLALIGQAGSLYPFLRSSALLRHLDGKTRNVPVVLLYPGTQAAGNTEGRGQKGLSFMGVLPADHDYRPRIYS